MSVNILSVFAKKSIQIGQSIGGASYGTWALSRFSLLNAEYLFHNAGRVQPVLEVEKVIARKEDYMKNFQMRKIERYSQFERIPHLYAAAKKYRQDCKDAEKRRDDNSIKVQQLIQKLKDADVQTDEIKELREAGKKYRDQLRTTTQQFHDINDELVDLILLLPNSLDPVTPPEKHEVLRSHTPPEGVARFKRHTHINWDYIPGLGPYNEFAHGDIVWLELDLAAKCQKYLLEAEFAETGNVDFVKRIVIEGAGMDPGSFLRIRDHKIKPIGINHATYLVGGATFPAFLALFAQSIIQNDIVLPIKYFVIGRAYHLRQNAPGTAQTSAVQSFVACRDEKEQDREFTKMAELMENFYSKTLGITFESRLLPAPALKKYERKKIAFVETGTEKIIGHIATVGDYVSKRLLCCYTDEERSPKFLNMVTAQFFNITDFLRPPKSDLIDPINKTDGASDVPPKGKGPAITV